MPETIELGSGRSDLLVQGLVAQLGRCRELLAFEQDVCGRAVVDADAPTAALARFEAVRRNAERILQLGEQARLRTRPVPRPLLAGVIGLQAAILEARNSVAQLRRESAERAALTPHAA